MNFALNLHILSLIFLISIFSGCNSYSEKNNSNNIFQDDLQHEVRVNIPINKIISLVPSITEILFAIRADSAISAVSHACSYPPQAKNKPIVTTFPSIDYEAIYKINPDIVLVSTEIFNSDITHRFNELSIPVYFFSFSTKDDICRAIKKMGELTGKSSEAEVVVDSLEEILLTFRNTHSHSYHPKTLILVSYDPMMAVGKKSFLNDLLQLAGGSNIINFDSADPYPQVTREFILNADPDVILTTGDKNSAHELFYTFPELSKTTAFRNKSIFSAKSEAFVRPSTRFIEVIKEIHGYLYGEK